MRLSQRDNLLLQAPQAPLQSSLGFHFSLWDTAPESHSSGWKSNFQAKFINSKFVPLCPCASIDLYYKGLFVPSSIYLAMKGFTERKPIASQALFYRQRKLLSFGFLSFARLSDPHSSSQPLLHLPIFQAEPHTEFLAHPCTLFKLPVCSRAVSLKPSYSHVSSDSSPPYIASKPGAFLAQAVVTEVSIRPSNLRSVLVRSSELLPGLCKF